MLIKTNNNHFGSNMNEHHSRI